jgi:replication factor C large subunit
MLPNKYTGVSLFGYSISSLDEIVGNEQAMLQMRNFAEDIEKGIKRRPLLLYGPSGTGKTESALALCKMFGWNVIELSAAEYRDKESIEKLTLSGANPKNVFGKRNAIILDEIDELAAKFDGGAPQAITNLISKSRSPIIFIANDMWDQKISFLRNKLDTIEFRYLDIMSMELLLRRFIRQNNLVLTEETIKSVAAKSGGDVRSAFNDAYALDGAKEGGIGALGLRNKKSNIFAVLDKIFLSMTYAAPIMAIAGADTEPDMMIKWIDENIPARYTEIKDLKGAFLALSDASMFYSRASRVQYYGYWRYMTAMMSSGVALAKSRYPSGNARYAFPRVIKELSANKMDRQADLLMAKKLQRVIHSGLRRITINEQKLLYQMCAAASKAGIPKEEITAFLENKFFLEKAEINRLLKSVAT